MKISDLKPAPYNPRKWSERAGDGLAASMERFGDISGITYNQRTGRLVSGHFRVSRLRAKFGDDLEITAEGIVTPVGTFPVRFVDWDDATEKAANVAANNRHVGGEFDENLGTLLREIEATQGKELFEAINLDAMLAALPANDIDFDSFEFPDGKIKDRDPMHRFGVHIPLTRRKEFLQKIKPQIEEIGGFLV